VLWTAENDRFGVKIGNGGSCTEQSRNPLPVAASPYYIQQERYDDDPKQTVIQLAHASTFPFNKAPPSSNTREGAILFAPSLVFAFDEQNARVGQVRLDRAYASCTSADHCDSLFTTSLERSGSGVQSEDNPILDVYWPS
jgi:hypothetical protein